MQLASNPWVEQFNCHQLDIFNVSNYHRFRSPDDPIPRLLLALEYQSDTSAEDDIGFIECKKHSYRTK